MERDLLLLRKHTDVHIVEELKKSHPEWITDKGFCPQCVEHYKAAMRGEASHVNISGSEVAKRWGLAVVAFIAAVGMFFFLKSSRQPTIYRTLLFPFLFLAVLGFLQAHKKHCVVIGVRAGHSARSRAIQILIVSILWAIILTLGSFWIDTIR